MEELTLADESALQGGFYVPQFELQIDGVSAPNSVVRDITQVTYKDSIKEIDSFEITVNNWDATTRRPKYIGFDTDPANPRSGGDEERATLFEPCGKRVSLRMGYAGDLRLMLLGTFTTLEPNFPASAPPTLSVRGLNVLHQLRRKQYSTTWNDKRDSEIATDLATLRDNNLPTADKRRIPLPLVVDTNAQQTEDPLPVVHEENQYDIDFLLTRARRRAYVVYIREGDPNARNPRERERHLYFGPSNGRGPGVRDVMYRLKWGLSLIDFKPTLTTANQVKSVTVNGWDRTRQRAITAKVTLGERGATVNADLHNLISACDAREEIVVDRPVHSEREALELARSILADQLKEIVKASATCIGLPDLRAGRRVVIEGLGPRFSGTYFITDSTHTIGDSGYITKFNARREQEGSLAGMR
jgi:phage protein D